MLQLDSVLTTAQNAAKLEEEAKQLRESADMGKSLRTEMATLTSRAAEDAAATKHLQQELTQAINDLAASQDELQVCKAELQRVQKQVRYAGCTVAALW
jgi:chromosome segregation ATPase